ncbi:unnamed protein product [Ectocarpus sp. 8 AP-2014]
MFEVGKGGVYPDRARQATDHSSDLAVFRYYHTHQGAQASSAVNRRHRQESCLSTPSCNAEVVKGRPYPFASLRQSGLASLLDIYANILSSILLTTCREPSRPRYVQRTNAMDPTASSNGTSYAGGIATITSPKLSAVA